MVWRPRQVREKLRQRIADEIRAVVDPADALRRPVTREVVIQTGLMQLLVDDAGRVARLQFLRLVRLLTPIRPSPASRLRLGLDA
jgi:hypothetical protein